jgi:uncharacterized protein YciI
MQFVIIGRDGTDEKALERRMAARESHIALGNSMREQGKALYGVAILDEKDKMVGSVYICDFESREELDQWLKEEPYVTGNVWQNIEIEKCKVGPSFAK